MENASEAMGSVSLSATEVQAFNDKFAHYNGEHQRGSEVNAMLRTVLTSNLTNISEEKTEMLVEVTGNVGLSTNATSITATADTSKLYTVVVNYGGEGGLVNSITVTEE